MFSLTENLSKLESINITGFTDNSNFVERDYAFISFSKNPKEALKYSKDALDNKRRVIGIISENDILKAYSEISISIRNIEKN